MNLWKTVTNFLKTKVNSKVIVWSLVGVIVVVGICLAWECLVFDKKYAQWETDRVEAMQVIERLEYERRAYYKASEYFVGRADTFKSQRDKVVEEWKASQVQIAEEILAVTELPMAEVASLTAKLLELEPPHVLVTDFGLEFSLVAAQRNLKALVWLDWHFREERPKMVFTLSLYKKESDALRAGYALLKETVSLMEEAITVYAEQAAKDATMVRRAVRVAKIKILKGVIGTVVVVGVTYFIVTELIIPLLRR